MYVYSRAVLPCAVLACDKLRGFNSTLLTSAASFCLATLRNDRYIRACIQGDDYLEVDVDIHENCYAARKLYHSGLSFLPRAVVELAMVRVEDSCFFVLRISYRKKMAVFCYRLSSCVFLTTTLHPFSDVCQTF